MNTITTSIFVRALKTFIQAFLASLGVALAATNLPNTTAAYRALIVGAIAAGISAAMNAILQPTTK